MKIPILAFTTAWLFAGAAILADDPPFRVVGAEPISELDEKFLPNSGWVGADGNYSIRWDANRVLWFYSDTWIGEIEKQKRVGSVLINNSVGVQTAADSKITVDFHWRKSPGEKPRALIVPEDGTGWYWLFAGTRVGDRLQLFLWQMVKTNDPGAFGFKNHNVALAEVANPADAPEQWRITQRPVPATIISPEHRIMFGSAILKREEQIYIYGVEERPGQRRGMVVARVAESEMADFTQWQFWTGEKWSANFAEIRSVVPGVASEYSVTWVPALERFVLTTNGEILSPKILARTAPEPWGPWSETVTLFECPEAAWGNGIFCYAGKAHASLMTTTSPPGELILTYASNGHNLSTVLNDTRLYRPRFVRVKLAR